MGVSVGAALGGTLIASLFLIFSLLRRRSKNHPEVPYQGMTSGGNPLVGRESGWRVEMETPERGSGARNAISVAYEIDGRQPNFS